MGVLLAVPGPSMSRREIALYVWASYLNTPYRWGGDDPLEGVDCSGLVIEGIASAGLVPRQRWDSTAHDLLHKHFGDRDRFPLLNADSLIRGALVFWSVDGKPTSRIRHVEIVWTRADGEVFTLGASGGGSRTVDRVQAIKQNAYVKIRRITPGWVAALDPFSGR